MSEINSKPTPMEEINTALEACKFGRFHVKLLFFAFVGTVAALLVPNTTSYLLPSAECDLNMDLLQKGYLTAAAHLGMVFSSVIAGFLTDTFGRKISLVTGYGGMFIFNLVAASSQTYEAHITAKFFEGSMFALATSALISYTSEFCYQGIRDRMMICQSSYVAVTGIVSPAMAWGILTQEWRVSLFDGYIVFNTWNFYLYIMSIWNLSACIMYSTLPESPKYLITQKKFREAMEILIKMYEANTGKPGDTFPHKNLWINEIKLANHEDCGIKISFQDHIFISLQNMKCLFKKPLHVFLVLLCVSKFFLMGESTVYRFWFPQLSTIVENNNISGNNDLCAILDNYTSALKTMANNATVTDICVPAKCGAETYINSIIVGFVSLLPYFITGALVTKVGKKPLLIVAGLISVGATLGLRWTNSKVALVSLFSLNLAIAQIIKSLQEMVTIELFPTAIRSVAVSIIMMCARIGTLVGNIAFPILLDLGCVVPFFTMSAMMICVTVISMFWPTK